jgi:hypothetical protein
MRKLTHMGIVIGGSLLLSLSQGIAASKFTSSTIDHRPASSVSLLSQRAVDALGSAEDARQRAIQTGYEHLPHTYDVSLRLNNINPHAPVADEIQQQIIARSLIANALLITNFNILMIQYLVNDAMIASRMVYLAISATTHHLRENGREVSTRAIDKIAARHTTDLQRNPIAQSHLVFFRRMLEKYYGLIDKLYDTVYDDVVKPQERDTKEDKLLGGPPGGPRMAPAPTAKKAPPKLKPLIDRPKTAWNLYPKFYRDILQKIDIVESKGKKRDPQIEIANFKRAIADSASGQWYRYEANYPTSTQYSESLVDIVEELGLAYYDIDLLMQMFSLIIPNAPARWAQIKAQSGRKFKIESPKKPAEQPKEEKGKVRADQLRDLGGTPLHTPGSLPVGAGSRRPDPAVRIPPAPAPSAPVLSAYHAPFAWNQPIAAPAPTTPAPIAVPAPTPYVAPPSAPTPTALAPSVIADVFPPNERLLLALRSGSRGQARIRKNQLIAMGLPQNILVARESIEIYNFKTLPDRECKELLKIKRQLLDLPLSDFEWEYPNKIKYPSAAGWQSDYRDKFHEAINEFIK